MLDVLARGGYVREIELCGANARACAGCSQASLCHLMRHGRVWTLTSKGSRAAAAD